MTPLYTFIDVDKSPRLTFAPQGEHNKLYLFAKKKIKRQLALAFANQEGVYFAPVLKEEKLAKALLRQLKKTLKKQPNAHFVIESPRGKIAQSLDKLLNRFPEAHIVLLANDDTDDDDTPPETTITPSVEVAAPAPKKDKSAPPAPQHPEWQPEKVQLVKPQSNKKTESQPKKKAVPVSKKPALLPANQLENFRENLEKNLLPKQHVLLDKVAKNHDKQNKKTNTPAFEHMMSRLDDVIGVLTQGYPKKKAVLLNELAQTLVLDMRDAEAVLENLIGNGMMQVDSAQNVKTSNLVHILTALK